jgi:hypothetical protein
MRYVGVDLHKTNFVVCFLTGQGKSQLLTFALDAEGIATFCRQLHRDGGCPNLRWDLREWTLWVNILTPPQRQPAVVLAP